MIERLEAGPVDRACDSIAGAAEAVRCSCGREGLHMRDFAIGLSRLGLWDAIRVLKKNRHLVIYSCAYRCAQFEISQRLLLRVFLPWLAPAQNSWV